MLTAPAIFDKVSILKAMYRGYDDHTPDASSLSLPETTLFGRVQQYDDGEDMDGGLHIQMHN